MRQSVLGVFFNIALIYVTVGAISGEDTITCEMESTDNTYPNAESFEMMRELEDEWNCVDELDNLYDFDGDWERIFDEHTVRSGVDSFTFRGVTIEPEPDPIYGLPTIVVHSDSEIELVSETERGRKLVVATSGELEVLVVRVTDASGEEPRLDGPDIANRVFGTYGNMESLKSQLEACSGDQLLLTPSTRTSDVVDGVLDVTIEVSVSDFTGADRKSLEKVVNTKLKNDGYPVRSFGLVMYIMPETANLGIGNVLGYAYVGGVKSVYKGVPTFQTNVHEVGHNLGLSHSGIEDSTKLFQREYGDVTCQMGYSVPLNYYDYPLKCFNGAKSFDIGWYNTEKVGHEVIGTQGSWRGRLVGVYDYFGDQYDDTGHRVIANIGSLYVMFNRAEDFTKDTAEANMVTVTEKLTEDNREISRTKVDGILTNGASATYETATGEKYTVVVCDISTDDSTPEALDYADVIVYRNDDDGSIIQTCDVVGFDSLPSELPSTAPSSESPSAAPSLRTPSPTSFQPPPPPECMPSEAVLFSSDGETTIDDDAPLIRVKSQNSTHVNFDVVNTFGGSFTSMFTLYTTGIFGEYNCVEEIDVEPLAVANEYSARCLGAQTHTMVKIWVADGNGGILGDADNAVIPDCCHQSQSADIPVAGYQYKLSCENPCVDAESAQQL